MIQLIAESKDYMLFRSNTKYDRNVVYLNSAAGLNRIGLNGDIPDPAGASKDKPLDNVFADNNVNEYSLFSKKADWFQKDSLKEIIDILKFNILGTEDQTVCYGSSMGGFAALHIAPMIGVKKVIAFSPQASLDIKMGILPSWLGVLRVCEEKYGAFKSNILNGKAKDLKVLLFYDDLDYLDYRHAETIIKNINSVASVKLSYAGHGSIGFVNKHFGVKNIVLSFLQDDLNMECLSEKLHKIKHPKKFYVYRDIRNLSTLKSALNQYDDLTLENINDTDYYRLINRCQQFIKTRNYIDSFKKYELINALNDEIIPSEASAPSDKYSATDKSANCDKSVICTLDRKLCTGCAACVTVCTKGALKIVPDEYGFLRPIIDLEKCNNCGLCTKRCSVLNPSYTNFESPKCYAFMADDNVRKESSSGGLFTHAYKHILDINGYVVGAKFNKDFSVSHCVTNDPATAKLFMGSKYIQSDTSLVLKDIKNLLKNGKVVLFTGMPCQVAGVKSSLPKEYENLITIDLLCHGIASYSVFKAYQRDIFHNKEISSLFFKSKKPWGWHAGVNAYFTDGTKYSVICDKDPYYQAYFKGYTKNSSCSTCKFNRLPRQGDLTIGDFWGISKYKQILNDDLGTSVVLINSKKGEDFFNKISINAKKVEEVPLRYAVQGNNNIVRTYPVNKDRHLFLEYLFNTNINFLNLYHMFINNELFMLNKTFYNEKFLITEYVQDMDLYDLAYYVFRHYNNRKIVTWVYSDKFNAILSEKFKLNVAFSVSLLKNTNKKIKHINEIANKNDEYYLVSLDRAYDTNVAKILNEIGFNYESDCAFRRIKPIEVKNFNLNAHSYTDEFGNTIEGSGIISSVIFKGFNNHIVLGKNIKGLSKVSFILDNNSFIEIGDNVTILENSSVRVYSQKFFSSSVFIGKKCFFTDITVNQWSPSLIRINDSLRANSHLSLSCCQGRKIIIGKDCLFASGIELQSGDGHTIFSVRDGRISNKSSYNNVLHIGDHVWVGKKSLILNGTAIGCGSIVGAGSIVKGTFNNNVTIGGNPAKQISRNKCWSIDGDASDIAACPKKYSKLTTDSKSPVSGKKVLVIGGTHRIGIALVNKLIELGNTVTILTRGNATDNFGHYVSRLRGDVESAEISSVLNGGEYDYVFDNLGYNSNCVFNVIKNVRCDRYVMLSSCVVYTMSADDYTIGRKNAEKMLFARNDVSTVSVRLPPILPDPRLKYIYNCIRSNKAIVIDNPNRDLAFVSSEEVANFLTWLATQDYTGTIDFAFEGVINLKRIIDYISSKSHKNPLVKITDRKFSEVIYPCFEAPCFNDFLSLDIVKKLGYQPLCVNDEIWRYLDSLT